jgi:hypothetical protein
MKIWESVRKLVGLGGTVRAEKGQLLGRVVGGGAIGEVDDHTAARDALDAQYVQRLIDLCTHENNLRPADPKSEDQEKDEAREDSALAVDAACDYDSRRLEEAAESPESNIEWPLGDKEGEEFPEWDASMDVGEYTQRWAEFQRVQAERGAGGKADEELA